MRTLMAGIGILLALALATPSAVAQVVFPLRTEGARIVDAKGEWVRLRGVNWFGAESSEFVVGGLDKVTVDDVMARTAAAGFNIVRLPWSNELVERDPVVETQLLAANPELQGKTGLQIFDAVVDSAGRHGLMVILDNHRSRGDWCCDEVHGDGLWHTPAYPETAWLADWKTMATRYRDRPHVVAAELRNEIRPDPPLGLTPTWGDGVAETDWHAAAMRGGEVVLAANPDLLIVVGGLDYNDNLDEVRHHPVVLSLPNRLVYAAHDYAWWRKREELTDPVAFAATSHERYGYVRDAGQTFTAPVWITEWGGCTQDDPQDPSACTQDRKDHIAAFARYAEDSQIDWMWWPLNGSQSAGYKRTPGSAEAYGLLTPDWSRWTDPDVMRTLLGSTISDR